MTEVCVLCLCVCMHFGAWVTESTRGGNAILCMWDDRIFVTYFCEWGVGVGVWVCSSMCVHLWLFLCVSLCMWLNACVTLCMCDLVDVRTSMCVPERVFVTECVKLTLCEWSSMWEWLCVAGMGERCVRDWVTEYDECVCYWGFVWLGVCALLYVSVIERVWPNMCVCVWVCVTWLSSSMSECLCVWVYVFLSLNAPVLVYVCEWLHLWLSWYLPEYECDWVCLWPIIIVSVGGRGRYNKINPHANRKPYTI